MLISGMNSSSRVEFRVMLMQLSVPFARVVQLVVFVAIALGSIGALGSA